MRKILAAGLVLAGWAMLWGSPAVHADEAEVIQVHPIEVYPGAVLEDVDHPAQMLTKDKLATVKQFFESHKQPEDRFEAFKETRTQGECLVFHDLIGNREETVEELRIIERIPDDDEPFDALGELKRLVVLGKHSEAEYQALEKQHKVLKSAFYRQVKDEKNEKIPEDEAIYRAASQQAHGELINAKPTKEEKAADQARSKDIKQKMKALKAKGDFAGMMKLAQETKLSPLQKRMMSATVSDMEKDAWPIWVKCLEDMAAAAYWTKIQYNGGALPQEQ